MALLSKAVHSPVVEHIFVFLETKPIVRLGTLIIQRVVCIYLYHHGGPCPLMKYCVVLSCPPERIGLFESHVQFTCTEYTSTGK